MAALQTTLLFLILLQTWVAADQKGQWKTATATYTMETDSSIIDGNVPPPTCESIFSFSFFLFPFFF